MGKYPFNKSYNSVSVCCLLGVNTCEKHFKYVSFSQWTILCCLHRQSWRIWKVYHRFKNIHDYVHGNQQRVSYLNFTLVFASYFMVYTSKYLLKSHILTRKKAWPYKLLLERALKVWDLVASFPRTTLRFTPLSPSFFSISVVTRYTEAPWLWSCASERLPQFIRATWRATEIITNTHHCHVSDK